MSTPLALRLALREARGGRGFWHSRALSLLFLCIFLGVFVVTAIGALSAAINTSLAAEGRTLLGGDIAVELAGHPPTATEERALARLGGCHSRSISLRAMASKKADETAPEKLVTLKAVDTYWPLYGRARLTNGGNNRATQEALAKGAVISVALAKELGLKPGDRLSLGYATFPISGVLTNEPDAASAGLAFGPTVLLALRNLPQTGLMQPGSLYHYREKVALPAGTSAVAARQTLTDALPDASWRILESSDSTPGISGFLGSFSEFLGFVGLLSLAIAGIGVSYSVRSFLGERYRTIAILKMLGTPAATIAKAYLLLILGTTLMAALAAALLGSLSPLLAKHLLAQLLPIPLETRFFAGPVSQAVLYGLLVALAASIPAVLRASALPAARIFRAGTTAWPWPTRPALLLTGGTLALLCVLIIASAHNHLFALSFLVGLLLVSGFLAAVAVLYPRLLRLLPAPKPFPLRLAYQNLVHRNTAARGLVLPLGIGLGLLASLSMVEGSFHHALRETIPAKAPSLVVIDIPKEEGVAFRALVQEKASLRMVPTLRGPITAINGKPVSALGKLPDDLWVLRGDRSVTFASTPPTDNPIVAGHWWPPDYNGPPLVSMEEKQADLLGLQVGDQLTLSALGVPVTARIASLRAVDWQALNFNFVLIYNPAALDMAPYSWMAALHGPPAATPSLMREITAAFPTVSILDIADITREVGRLASQMLIAVRLAGFSLVLAGIAVLAGAMATREEERRQENVLLKLLGATRKQLVAASLLEFLFLGFLTSLLAIGLGGATSWLVARQLLSIPWQPDWAAAALLLAGATLLIPLVGLLGSWRTLRAPVNAILRTS